MISFTGIKRPKVQWRIPLVVQYGLAYAAWVAWVVLVRWVI